MKIKIGEKSPIFIYPYVVLIILTRWKALGIINLNGQIHRYDVLV